MVFHLLWVSFLTECYMTIENVFTDAFSRRTANDTEWPFIKMYGVKEFPSIIHLYIDIRANELSSLSIQVSGSCRDS